MKNIRIWVILPSYECEGYGCPVCAFTSEDKAKAEVERLYDTGAYKRRGNPTLDIEETVVES